MDQTIVDDTFMLQKMEGKGGWTYTILPQQIRENKKQFGWRKVRGRIDTYEIRKYNLMPMKGGELFLPIKAEIRKSIQKEAGSYVHIVLYPDDEPLALPDEMELCLSDDPDAHRFFKSLSESEQIYYLQWIYSAKREETKIDRMAIAIDRLSKGLKMYDK